MAGDKAKGFISVGGASTPEIQSDYMKEFIAAYKKRVGEWNDEAGTKVYALELILAVLKKNPAALNDVEVFKKEMASFSMTNPFVKGDAPSWSSPAMPTSAAAARWACRWWSASSTARTSRHCLSEPSKTEAPP